MARIGSTGGGARGESMIAVELRKLVMRPRMWLSVALLCLLPAVVAVVLKVSDFPPPSGQGGAFLSAVLRNGALFPAAALALVLPVFLPLAVAVMAGDSVAGGEGRGRRGVRGAGGVRRGGDVAGDRGRVVRDGGGGGRAGGRGHVAVGSDVGPGGIGGAAAGIGGIHRG